jgi:hypothetical protein
VCSGLIKVVLVNRAKIINNKLLKKLSIIKKSKELIKPSKEKITIIGANKDFFVGTVAVKTHTEVSGGLSVREKKSIGQRKVYWVIPSDKL